MVATKVKAVQEPIELEDMPLTTLREYKAYNEAARKENKRLGKRGGICVHPIKQCPVELHPKQRVILTNIKQPKNEIPVHLSNHLIHFDEKLTPNKEYDLPVVVVNYLAEKATPIRERLDNPDGTIDVRITGQEHRFSIRTVYQGD